MRLQTHPSTCSPSLDRRTLSQIALPLAWPARHGEAEFFVSAANREAVAWLAEPARWPMPRTVLAGPPGSGKTHLAAMFAARHPATIIDNADTASDAEALFHAWNAATPDRPLLLTARTVPWSHGLADLASRLAATPLVRLADPDDALLAAMFAKHMADRGLTVPPEVAAYVLARLERSAAAVGAAAAALDTLALAEKRAITVPLARAVLEEQFRLEL